ncbi:succinyldiaminopimelate transaminase [Reinekea marina]|uniref:Succinyldiaminopimelate transaminase n=1 Tax=Reinekea marina TaxID=1310421 RepID=A0ABV7WTM5_9GAMM|nr:succinyldiaminopimelate transaminase [Reinekea marina]MDN3649973.1 succinyldiaminopimelate transaminase [Reinekea marina]
MNPRLSALHPYPFEKLRALLADVTPAEQSPIAWSVGEPKHAAPSFVEKVLNANLRSFENYPATAGTLELREAISAWCYRRFKLKETDAFSAEANVLPVTGTREALFSVVQALFDSESDADEVWMPNPFYQIYEGATLLAGGKTRYLDCTKENDYQPDYRSINDEQWQQCQMLFICTPGNPSGTTLSIETLKWLIKKSIQHNFIIFSDECYSELYRDEANPPAGLLQAASDLGHNDFKNCLVFHSLSKRSNLPGLRSGFTAGDSERIATFLRYRTYHGCAMPIPHQKVSIAAWQDETHVINNRKRYNEKYRAVTAELKGVLPLSVPDASFYLWPDLETDDLQVTKDWLSKANIRVLPGQYLSRTVDGVNPGYGHVRVALVAPLDDCITAAKRLKNIL